MKVDNFLRELLFRKFRIAGMTFDFLEALLAVCITGVGLVLRIPFICWQNGIWRWQVPCLSIRSLEMDERVF